MDTHLPLFIGCICNIQLLINDAETVTKGRYHEDPAKRPQRLVLRGSTLQKQACY
jgi:hypothetical protein